MKNYASINKNIFELWITQYNKITNERISVQGQKPGELGPKYLCQTSYNTEVVLVLGSTLGL